MIRAGIDIGTNTILLLIAEVETNKVVKVLRDEVRVVRLGQGVDQNKAFHPEAIVRARKCFAEYAEILKNFPQIPVRALATSGSRDAKNSAEFFASVKNDYGIPVEVISGDEEALVSFLGALSGEKENPESLAVLDIGGGSTEIVGLAPETKGIEAKNLFKFSFDLGCVRMAERFLHHDPALPEELAALKNCVKEELAKKQQILSQVKNKQLVAVAGTATYLAATHLGLPKFDPVKVHGAVVTKGDLYKLVQNLALLSTKERLGLGGMDQGRADVIVAGAIILQEILESTKVEMFRASVRGLRYGAILS